jgi:hypothetical protein
MLAPSRTRLRRGLLYLARVLWLLFALSNLTSVPFGVRAYYTHSLSTGRSVPAVARAHCNAPDGCAGSPVLHRHPGVGLAGVPAPRCGDLLAAVGHLA